MRIKRRSLYWLFVLTIGWLLCRPHLAHALPLDLNKGAEEPRSRFQSPEDLIELIPVLNQLPRSFVFGRGYTLKLSGQSLRINHFVKRRKEAPRRRDCFLGLSYVTPVAGFFTSRIDVPLFYAPTPSVAAWSVNNMGDYAATFSRGTQTQALRLAFNAKF